MRTSLYIVRLSTLRNPTPHDRYYPDILRATADDDGNLYLLRSDGHVHRVDSLDWIRLESEPEPCQIWRDLPRWVA